MQPTNASPLPQSVYVSGTTVHAHSARALTLERKKLTVESVIKVGGRQAVARKQRGVSEGAHVGTVSGRRNRHGVVVRFAVPGAIPAKKAIPLQEKKKEKKNFGERKKHAPHESDEAVG